MSTNATERADTRGRFHPVVRVLLYFLALAIVNRVAFAAVAALLPSIPGWLLDLLEGAVYLVGALAGSRLYGGTGRYCDEYGRLPGRKRGHSSTRSALICADGTGDVEGAWRHNRKV